MTYRPLRIRAGRTIIPAVLVSSLITACASGQSADTDCGDELKVGILTAFTGEFGDYGKASKNAFDLAIAEVESSGQLPKDWSISTVVADEESDVEVGLRTATDMMQNDEVSAIVGPSSGAIVAMDSIADRYRIPVVSQYAGTTNFDSVGGEYLFRTISSDASDGAAVAKYLSDTGADDVVIVLQNDQATITAGSTAQQDIEEAGGQVIKTIKYNPQQPSYQAVVQQAVSEDADAIFLAGGQESATTILREMRDLGVDSSKLVLSSDQVAPGVIDAVGPQWATGLAGVTARADEDRPQYKALSNAYETEFGEKPGPFVENAYDATMLIVLAALAANSTCGSAIAEQLPKVSSGGTAATTFADAAHAAARGKDVDYDGASGPVDFDDTGTVAGSYAVYKVTNGEWTVAEFYPAESLTE